MFEMVTEMSMHMESLDDTAHSWMHEAVIFAFIGLGIFMAWGVLFSKVENSTNRNASLVHLILLLIVILKDYYYTKCEIPLREEVLKLQG